MSDNAVVVVPYSDAWPEAFNRFKTLFTAHLKAYINDIVHVGSTAVPGLAAKPIIDIDIIIPDLSRFNEIAAILNNLGYRHIGDLGIPGREAFKGMPNLSVAGKTGSPWPKHHLYVCVAGNSSLRNHLLLKEYLLAHPEAAAQYGKLKKQLAEKYPDDIDSYVEGKTEFITGILEKKGFTADVLSNIKKQNEKPRGN